jgi:dienelactone hydrolase
MAEVLLFHHALGRTPGFLGFADELRAAGHTVHTPDSYDGHVFDDLEQGVTYARSVGHVELFARASAAAEDLPPDLVYGGFSLGSGQAQYLAQTRPGARGALLYHDGIPVTEFSPAWPAGVGLQIHTSEADPWVDLNACRELVEAVPGAELFIYPGSAHLFADPSSGEYEAGPAGLLMQRTLQFLASLP